MADLFGDRPPAEVVNPIELESLAQKRVERLVGSSGGRAVRGDRERGHQRHLLPLVFAFSGLVEQLTVLELLGDTLKHGYWFGEVHGDGYL